MHGTLGTAEPLTRIQLGGRVRMSQKKRTRQIRVDDDVAAMADELAAIEKKSSPALLSDILRPLLRARLEKGMERRMKELKGKEPKE